MSVTVSRPPQWTCPFGHAIRQQTAHLIGQCLYTASREEKIRETTTLLHFGRRVHLEAEVVDLGPYDEIFTTLYLPPGCPISFLQKDPIQIADAESRNHYAWQAMGGVIFSISTRAWSGSYYSDMSY
jgi:hypothetical protein